MVVVLLSTSVISDYITVNDRKDASHFLGLTAYGIISYFFVGARLALPVRVMACYVDGEWARQASPLLVPPPSFVMHPDRNKKRPSRAFFHNIVWLTLNLKHCST